MKAIKAVQNRIQEAYIITIIALLGAVAFVTAVLIAYPALAYLGSKLFM